MKDFPGRCAYVTPSCYAAMAALRLRRCLATLHLCHPFALRCNGSAASSLVPHYAAPTSPLRATLQRQRCVFVGASLRCTYVNPSRYAATAALRLRRRLATLYLRHPFTLRDVSRAATLQRSSTRMDSYKRMDRRTVGGDGMKPCRSNCVEATKDTTARTNSY